MTPSVLIYRGDKDAVFGSFQCCEISTWEHFSASGSTEGRIASDDEGAGLPMLE